MVGLAKKRQNKITDYREMMLALPWIVVIGLTISLMVGVVTETARLIGGPLLASIVLGIYHRPVREQLIVMFLDLADSTRLAEKLGELRVHDLITRFFFDIDEPINEHGFFPMSATK
jgi:adenylate cyclase